jgi:glycosyltransferase involved in cell wall biosynthesis
VNYFITPDLTSISGGNKYDINVLKYLNSNRCKIINIPIPQARMRLEKIFFNLKTIPNRSTVIIDGLIASNISYLSKILSKKYRIILLIHHPVSYENHQYGNILIKLKEKQIFSSASQIITVSKTMKRVIKKILNKEIDIKVISPGVDDIFWKHKKNNDTNGYNIITTGSIIPRKNLETCIETLNHMDDKWTLTIIGKNDKRNSYFSYLSSLVDEYELNDRVKFLDCIDDINVLIDFLKKAKVYLCLSKYEGYGMANIECAALGLPLVVSDIPVFRENLVGYRRKYVNLRNVKSIVSAIVESSPIKKNIKLKTWQEVGNSFKRVLYG